MDAGFFNINYETVLTVTDGSKITNLRGGIGGFIYATGFSSVYISGNTVM